MLRAGLEPVRALQHLRAAAVNAEDARHLGIPAGSPVMATVRHGYLADGRPVVHARSIAATATISSPRCGAAERQQMDQTTLAGRILTPVGWVTGTIRCTAQVLAIEPGPAPDDRFIVPGFVDLHVHGGHGADAWRERTRSAAWPGSTPATARRRCSRPR